MEKSEFLVESPPKPPRKACQSGKFVMPRQPGDSTPVVTALRQLSLIVYNQIADLKLLKVALEAELLNAEGEMGLMLQRGVTFLNKKIHRLRKLGYMQREYILDVEGSKPLNEPKEWVRN